MRSNSLRIPFDLQLSLRAEGRAPGRDHERATVTAEEPPTTLGGIAVSDHFDLVNGYEGPVHRGVCATRRSRSRSVASVRDEPKLKAYIEITSPPSDATSLAEQRRHGAASSGRAPPIWKSVLRL